MIPDPPQPHRLRVFNAGFLTQPRIRRILQLAGYPPSLGWPRAERDGPCDLIGIWGQSPTAHRGEAVARRSGAPILRVEDAFLRSLHPGRSGEPPMGLLLDRSGLHFDPSTPSDLEQILAHAPLDDSAVLNRARAAMDRLRASHLSKYSAVDPDLDPPPPGYVLVVDQTRGDASVRASGADRARFLEMLVFAQEEHPGAPVLIKTHPETRAGHRPGHFGPQDESARVRLFSDPVSPWALLEGAVGVYTVSSQLGFEAILAGHRPRVFGQPFYAGWGLSEDDAAPPRRQRRLTRAQLFAGAMIHYPVWYDPFRDALCELETVLDNLEASARVWREDRHGWTASEMRLWKRGAMQGFFGGTRRVRFTGTPRPSRRHMVWASAQGTPPPGAVRVEDGFLRSRGLGAELVPPLSLVADDLGIYYDPATPSRLEALIADRASLRPDQHDRAARLIAQLTRDGLSKYNTGAPPVPLPEGHRILVPGQVEDDASIRRGAGEVRSNLDLLRAVRAANPDAVVIYKPHPDVEAGLRAGAINPADLADLEVTRTDPATLLEQVQEVWTITSLMGFEALLRGLPVTTLGAPFYAGWGLTRDLGPLPERRTARPTLEGLVHAALIDYPRYRDPRTGQPCPVEVIARHLARGDGPGAGAGPGLRVLSKLQGLFASAAPFWR